MRSTKSFLFVVCLLTAPLLQSQEPDAFLCIRPKLYPQTAFAQKLTALPEWKPFCELFCNAVDKGITRELADRQKLERVLPAPFADLVAQAVTKRGFTFRQAVEKVVSHLDAVIFVAETNDSRRPTGLLAAIVDVDPSPSLGWVRILPDLVDGVTYNVLKEEANGDFISAISFRHQGMLVKFCFAVVKLPDSRYALLFSDEANIQRYFGEFKEGRTGEEYAEGFVEKLVIGNRFFRFFEEFGTRHHWSVQAAEVCAKIEKVELGVRDIDGATHIEGRVSLRQSGDAAAAYAWLRGSLAFVQFSTDARIGADFLQTISIELNEPDAGVAVAIKLDHPALWSLMSHVLSKASDGIRKRGE